MNKVSLVESEKQAHLCSMSKIDMDSILATEQYSCFINQWEI